MPPPPTPAHTPRRLWLVGSLATVLAVVIISVVVTVTVSGSRSNGKTSGVVAPAASNDPASDEWAATAPGAENAEEQSGAANTFSVATPSPSTSTSPSLRPTEPPTDSAPPSCAALNEQAAACGAATEPGRPRECCDGLVCEGGDSAYDETVCVAPTPTLAPSLVNAIEGEEVAAPIPDTQAPSEKPTIAPNGAPTASPTAGPTEQEDSDPFVFTGSLEFHSNLGISVASGLNIRVIAKSGSRVKFTSPSAKSASSQKCKFHVRPDGAATFAVDRVDANGQNDTSAGGGDWYYCSNSEVKEFQRSSDNRCNGGLLGGKCRAGVYCLLLDSDGLVRDYVHRLGGDDTCGYNDGVGPNLPSTSTNCQGGATPWGSWVSCEESAGGYCWQVDPSGRRAPREIAAIGNGTDPGEDGRGWEAMAVDGNDASCPTFYFTEDRADGSVRRLRPDCRGQQEPGWDMLHEGKITVDYLELVGGCRGTGESGIRPLDTNGTFRWTTDAEAAANSAAECYPYCEGITVAAADDGSPKVHFVTKALDIMYSLSHDGDAGTTEGGLWEADVTHTNDLLEGDGNFGLYPDQITTQITARGNFIYHTTDGSATPGVYVHNFRTRKYYTLWQSVDVGEGEEESVGHALSPDGRFIVGALQKDGRIFLLSRKDGGYFRGLDFALRRRHR